MLEPDEGKLSSPVLRGPPAMGAGHSAIYYSAVFLLVGKGLQVNY